MEDIKTINVFDFDDTIVRAPGYTNKKAVEKSHPEITFSDPMSFYDHSKSLCEEIHNIQVIEPVYKEWKKGIEDKNTLTVLITHRVKELQPEVFSILNKRDMKFDRSYFLGRTTDKPSILKEILDAHPEVKRVRVFEDSIQQVYLYQRFFEENKISGIELEMHIVDKSRMYRISNFKLTNERRIRLI